MAWKQRRARIRYGVQYLPFTMNTLLFTLVLIVSYRLLYRAPAPKDDAVDTLRPFVLLLGEFVLWVVVVLALLSVLSALASWLYYLWLLRREDYRLEVQFRISRNTSGGGRKLYLDTAVKGVVKPVLGFVKARLFYDDGKMTDRFGLLSARRKKNSLLREAITGSSRVLLPDIREYKIRGGFIYFEDLLQLVSLPVKQRIQGDFYQPPTELQEEDADVAPRKTDRMDIRIEQLRKVEGEYFNYKDFEAGDDVRRIVWKVYARNRDLVVRVPERMEPYASHLYFYASFHNSLSLQALGNAYYDELLNFYKNNVWSVYQSLRKKEWQVRYIPDQQFTLPGHLNEEERTERIISNSQWQKNHGLADYFNARTGTVLVVSSLTDPQELAALLDETDNSVQVYYVKLSLIFRSYAAWSWIKRILFLPPKDRLGRLRSSWPFSPLRRQILRREKELERILG